MKFKLINIFFGVLLIFASIWEFDSSSWNKIAVSAVLFLSGLSSFLTDTESHFIQKVRDILIYSTVLIISLVIIKKMVWG